MHILPITPKDYESLETILSANTFDKPNAKISVYKNRRGRYKDILLWCKANRGTCKIEPMFATNYLYELIPMEDLKINIKPSMSSSAF